MATTSLGRLTLDLAVKLSEFTDGMTRAERETKQKTEKMTQSVNSFKDNLVNALGGSQVGGAIDGLSSKLGVLKGNVAVAGAALAGMAIGGAVVATGALARMAIETAKADTEMVVLANRANTSVRSFQVLGKAAEQLGVTQDQLGSILADVQEKLGEFSATEGGGAADFFEALQNNTSLTTDEIRNLGKVVQGKDGVEAIQLLKDKMDELGATSQEQRFVFESLASDLGNLLPLFENGGDLLNRYGAELEAAGVIKTEEAIKQSQQLAAQTQALHTRYDGLKQQLAGQMMPVLNNLIGYFVDGTKKGNQFGGIVRAIGYAAKATATVIVGLAAGISALVKSFASVYSQFENIGQTGRAFWEADGVLGKIDALNAGMTRAQTIHAQSVDGIISNFKSAGNAIGGMWNDTLAEGDNLSNMLLEINSSAVTAGNGLALSTKQADENAKANEKAAKAKDKHTKAIEKYNAVAVNSRVLEQAAKHNYAGIEKKYGLPQGVLAALSMQESRGNPNAVSPVGAKGAFQFMPGTAKRFGIAGQETNIAKSAEAAAKYLNFLMKKFGSVELALAGYNAGEGNVQKYGNKIPPFKETQKYVPAVMSYLSFMQGKDISKGGNTVSVSGLLESEQRAAEKLAQEQQSIRERYMNEREKSVYEHNKKLAEIDAKFGKGSVEAIKYRAEEEARYQEEQAARVYSVMSKYQSEEEKLEHEFQQTKQEIRNKFAEDSPEYAIAMDRLEVFHREELQKIREQDAKKYIQQQQHIEGIRRLMQQSGYESAATVGDIIARNTMRPEEYQRYSLGSQEDSARAGVNAQYADREAEINRINEIGEYEIASAGARYELLQEAKREHEAAMYAVELEYSDKRKELQKQESDMRMQATGEMFSGMSSLTAMFFGEQSKEHRAAIAAQRAFAIAQVLMNAPKTASDAYAALAPIPIVGPALGIAAAAAAITTQLGYAAQLKSTNVSGIAHGGLDYVPSESTYLLDKGERVLSPKQNQDLTKFMQNGGNGSPQINIINNAPGYEAVTTTNADGSIDVKIEKRIQQSWNNLQNPNSHESKMLGRNVQAPRRR